MESEYEKMIREKFISLPSPILKERLRLKGEQRTSEEESHYKLLLKDCPDFNVKCASSEKTSLSQTRLRLADSINLTREQVENIGLRTLESYVNTDPSLSREYLELTDILRTKSASQVFTVTARTVPKHFSSCISSETIGIHPILSTSKDCFSKIVVSRNKDTPRATSKVVVLKDRSIDPSFQTSYPSYYKNECVSSLGHFPEECLKGMKKDFKNYLKNLKQGNKND